MSEKEDGVTSYRDARSDEQARAAAERIVAVCERGANNEAPWPGLTAFINLAETVARAYLELLDRPSPPPVLSNWREIREECARVADEWSKAYGAGGGQFGVGATIRALPAPPGAGGDEG